MGGVPKRARTEWPGSNSIPPEGWIKTMRLARGLSLRQAGKRLGIQASSLHVSERREREGGSTIYQLQRVAAALDCDLFYAFVPRGAADTVHGPSRFPWRTGSAAARSNPLRAIPGVANSGPRVRATGS
jgi:transcriptional regulator with XRE-family HTH domain